MSGSAEDSQRSRQAVRIVPDFVPAAVRERVRNSACECRPVCVCTTCFEPASFQHAADPTGEFTWTEDAVASLLDACSGDLEVPGRFVQSAEEFARLAPSFIPDCRAMLFSLLDAMTDTD